MKFNQENKSHHEIESKQENESKQEILPAFIRQDSHAGQCNYDCADDEVEDGQLESDRLRYVRRSALFPVKGRMGSAPMSILIGRFMLILQLLLGLILPWLDDRNLQQVPSLQEFRSPNSAWSAGFFTSVFFTAFLALICYFEYKGITAKSLVRKRVVEKKLSLLVSLFFDFIVLLLWIFS